MKSSIAFVAAAAAPLAAALQQSQSGGALVINNCDKDMPYQNIPATTAGVYNAEPTTGTLTANGGKYFTPWFALSSGVQGGWSIKINPNDNWDNIFQYEYTYRIQDDPPVIWYDMSFVNGKEDTLPGWSFACPEAKVAPHNKGYQNATDDLAMQDPVDPSATVTLHLCPEGTGAASAPSGYSSSATVSAPVQTTPPPTPSTTLQTYSSKSSALSLDLGLKQAKVEQAPTNTEPMVVVTAYETKVVTAVVTETAIAHQKHRRHEHRHPHGHSF